MLLTHALLLALMLIGGAETAALQDQERVTRAIDIRDLLIPIPDFAGASIDEREGEKAVPSQEDIESQLLSTIRMALAETPQDGLTLAIKDGRLQVTGTPAQQEALVHLVQALKRHRDIQINVEVRLINLSKRAAASLSDEMKTKLACSHWGPVALSDDELAKLLPRPGKEASGVQAFSAPNLTTFNQQHSHVQIVSSEFYKADFVRDEHGGWDPVVGTVWTGVQLTVQAAARADGSEVAAAVEVVVQRLLGFDELPVEGTELFKQSPRLERLEFNRIAVGSSPTLLEARQIPPAEQEVAADGPEPHIMLVVVRLTPIVGQHVQLPARDAATR